MISPLEWAWQRPYHCQSNGRREERADMIAGQGRLKRVGFLWCGAAVKRLKGEGEANAIARWVTVG